MIYVSRRAVLARALAGIAAAGLLAPPAWPDTDVDVQLVLAVDTSGSVTRERFERQKQGYVLAFRDPRVLAAIAGLPNQSMDVTMMQWTGPTLHVQVVPWTRVGDAASAGALSDLIAASTRRLFGGGTSISGAIDESRRLFGLLPVAATRRVIDISGDGANNNGRPAQEARDAAVADGIVINGLPMLNVEPDLDVYYRTQVIGGPGAFMIAIDDDQQFAEAIVHKLVTEIAAVGGGVQRIQFARIVK